MSKKIYFHNNKFGFFPLGIGTASFAGVNMVNDDNYLEPEKKDVEKFLNYAFDLYRKYGLDMVMIDTSSQYGESERKLSEYFNNNPDKLNKTYLCTKWGLKFDQSNFNIQDYSLKNLDQTLKNSLKLLKKIDLFYIHTNPAVSTSTLKKIIDNESEIYRRLVELKKKNIGGISHLGISISSAENLNYIIENNKLINEFDVIQINSNLLSSRPDFQRRLNLLDKIIILNSLYRKGDKHKRSSIDGRKEIFFDALNSCNNPIILTGTKSESHLKETFSIVNNFKESVPFLIEVLSDDSSNENKKIEKNLNDYFRNLNDISNPKNKIQKVDEKEVVKYITNCFIGSLKTRIGPSPDERQYEVLQDIVEYYVKNKIPVQTILTWGPKKFFSGRYENHIDLSELISIQTLYEINKKICLKYPYGVIFTIFIEDYEGKFIEGNHLELIFNEYITSFEKLVKITNMQKIIKIIRTQDLLKTNFDINMINLKLNDNYIKLKNYWIESEKKGIEGSENFESYKQINKIGWYEKIGNDTRDYYIKRLDRILGNTKSKNQKIDMTVRLLACVLIHRQFDVFKVNEHKNPVKLSFLKISGGPKKLMDGRVDIRTLPTNISKKHISAWAAKGCLKIKNNIYSPCLFTWQEVYKEKEKFKYFEIRIKNMYNKIKFGVSVLKK